MSLTKKQYLNIFNKDKSEKFRQIESYEKLYRAKPFIFDLLLDNAFFASDAVRFLQLSKLSFSKNLIRKIYFSNLSSALKANLIQNDNFPIALYNDIIKSGDQNMRLSLAARENLGGNHIRELISLGDKHIKFIIAHNRKVPNDVFDALLSEGGLFGDIIMQTMFEKGLV